MSRRAYRGVVLAALPGAQREISERTGLGAATAHRWLKDLHAAGEAHIGGWAVHPHGGPITAIYHAGPGEDVPCDVRIMSDRQRSRGYRQAMRASGEWEDVKARRRATYHARKPVVRRDPLMVGLFGVA